MNLFRLIRLFRASFYLQDSAFMQYCAEVLIFQTYIRANPFWIVFFLWLIQITALKNCTVPPLFLNVSLFFFSHSWWMKEETWPSSSFWKDPPVGIKPELWQGQNFFVGCFCAVIPLSILMNVCTGILVPSQIFIYHDSHVPGWSFVSERRLSCLSSPFMSPLSYYCILDKMGKQTLSNPKNN